MANGVVILERSNSSFVVDVCRGQPQIDDLWSNNQKNLAKPEEKGRYFAHLGCIINHNEIPLAKDLGLPILFQHPDLRVAWNVDRDIPFTHKVIVMLQLKEKPTFNQLLSASIEDLAELCDDYTG